MEFIDFKKLIKRKRGTIASLSFLLIVLVMGVSLLNPLKYSAKSRLLVVQNAVGADPYSVSRSNEYLGNLFSQVAYSGSFFNLVLNSQYNIDKTYFGGSYGEQLKLWQKTISTKTQSDTGIIEINVYHPNPDQARLISLAVNDILINQNANYQGGGQGVKVSILDQPLVSDYPNQPNLLYNFAFALALGLVLSLMFIYLYPESHYDVRLWPKKRSKRKLEKHVSSADNYRKEFSHEERVKEELANKNIFENKGDMNSILR
jgi:capsular polysaccharide biosynthesis protein